MRMTACSSSSRGRPHADQLAIAQHGDPIGDLEDLFQVMGDIEDAPGPAS